jgi:hypothetical protein
VMGGRHLVLKQAKAYRVFAPKAAGGRARTLNGRLDAKPFGWFQVVSAS